MNDSKPELVTAHQRNMDQFFSRNFLRLVDDDITDYWIAENARYSMRRATDSVDRGPRRQ